MEVRERGRRRYDLYFVDYVYYLCGRNCKLGDCLRRAFVESSCLLVAPQAM